MATTGMPPYKMEIDRVIRALETIAGSLQTIAQGPSIGGKPAGDGLLKVLNRLADAAEKLAPK